MSTKNNQRLISSDWYNMSLRKTDTSVPLVLEIRPKSCTERFAGHSLSKTPVKAEISEKIDSIRLRQPHKTRMQYQKKSNTVVVTSFYTCYRMVNNTFTILFSLLIVVLHKWSRHCCTVVCRWVYLFTTKHSTPGDSKLTAISKNKTNKNTE